MARQLARYTPSLMSHDELEALYVPRSTVLDKIAHRIEKAGMTEGRNHTLLVGGRGAGKTHVISMAYHRAKAQIDDLNVQLAWLDEDPWLILRYEDLLAHIIERLEPEAVDPGDDLAYYIRRRAEERGPIVVFTENFDQILDQIGPLGQQELRHLLQTHKSLLLVASTTNLAHHTLQEQSAPFYGFLTETRLIPFRRDQAAAMLTNISTLNGDQELAIYLKTPQAASRLAVVEHLAGGAPRMWATLGTALEVDGLDDLVDHLMATFDDLTPYYQEQLARLSGHQRRVVAALGQLDRPMSTVDLAGHLKIDQRSLSKTIHDLKERGWVRACESPFIAMLDKRSTYYELAEPLARIAFQLKANRGEPLRVVVDFLKGWFAGSQLAEVTSVSDLASNYVTAALVELEADFELISARQLIGARNEPDAAVLDSLLACDRALEALQDGDATAYFNLGAPMRSALESLADMEPGSELISARWLLHIHALFMVDQAMDSTSIAAHWIAQASTLRAEVGSATAAMNEMIQLGWRGIGEAARVGAAARVANLDMFEDESVWDPWVAVGAMTVLALELSLVLTSIVDRGFSRHDSELGPTQSEFLEAAIDTFSLFEKALASIRDLDGFGPAAGVAQHLDRTIELLRSVLP